MRQIWTFSILLAAIVGFAQSTNPVPFLESVSPPFVWAGSGDTTVVLRGKNFRSDSIVQVYREEAPFDREPPVIPLPILILIPRFAGSEELLVNLPETQLGVPTALRLGVPTTLRLVVRNPPPGGGGSQPVTFQIRLAGSLLLGGSLISARFGHRAAVLEDGHVLMIGGHGEGQRLLSSVELRDPCTGSWNSGPSMSVSRFRPTLTVLSNGKALVTGGVTDGEVPLNAIEVFDPVARAWSTGPSMSTARILHTATLLPGGAVLVAGGFTREEVPVADVEIYDPRSGTWTRAAPLRSPRAGHSAVLLPSGKVLVAGGAGSERVVASSEIYDPAAGTWTSAGSLAEARYRHEATLLQDGGVLATGGLGLTNSPLDSVELYDPQADVWTPVRSMDTGRYGHTATLLPSGLVLVAGGSRSFDRQPTYVLLYDRKTNRWISGPELFPRDFHTATLLPGGHVLLAGGAGPSRRVELYQLGPASDAPEQLVRESASTLEPGTYTATVSLRRCDAAPTSWRMEIVPKDGVLSGGVRFGGEHDASQAGTTSATFLLDSPQVVTLSASIQPSPTVSFSSVFANLLGAFGRTLGNFSHSQFFSALLPSGQYVARLSSTFGTGSFAVSVTAGFVSGRLSINGYAAPGLTGFCEFRVPNRQQVQISIFKTAGEGAALDVLDLLLTDRDGRSIPQTNQP